MILQRIRPGVLKVAEFAVVSDVTVLGLHVARDVAPTEHLATLFTCVGAPLVRHLSIFYQELCWNATLLLNNERLHVDAQFLYA